MDLDDDDGVGFITNSHFLRSGAVPLLSIPPKDRRDREASVSSSITDMDVPIYAADTLSTRPISVVEGGFTWKLAFAIAAGAFGSAFQHGYNTGVLNNPEGIMKSWINESITEGTGSSPSQGDISLIWSIIVAIYCLGGMIGGALTGPVANRFGRKGGLLLNNVLVALAVILETTAKSAGHYELITAGRFFIGINSGLNAGLAPMYLSEISPVNLRGSVGTVYQLVITISIFIAQVLGLKSVLAEQWPILLAMTAVPAIFQIITLPLCPESPKYLLVSRGKEVEAQNSLIWLRGTDTVQDEMNEMRAEFEALKLLPKVTLRELISNSALRLPLIISLVMMLAQQLSGINAVIFFSTQIFTDANISAENATYATLGMGAINVLMTVVSLILVEKAGRKTLLLVGFSGMAVDTILLMLCLIFSDTSGFARYMSVVTVLVYIIMFASGPGSIPWFLVSELFNQSARPAATSVAVAVNWAANFLVGLGFPLIKDAIGPYVFIIFIVCLILSVLFIFKKVPETKNKTMEEISAMFRQQSYQ